MDYRPSKYHGGENALECLSWIMKMEQTFWLGDFTESQKVIYVVRMLKNEALWWWDAINKRLNDVA